MRTAIAVAISLVSFTASPVASADPAPDITRMVTDDCAAARKAGKTCVLVVPPEDVRGDRPGAGDIDIRIRRFDPAGSLIRLRRDFIPEIVRAGEEL
jgi:hypothetical protein